MAAAAPLSSAATPPERANDLKFDIEKQIRSHEVAIAELNSLPSSRAVYQRNGNIFFRTTIEKARAFEQSIRSLPLAPPKKKK